MRLGFIGLGTMGLPMAGQLVKKSGCQVLGYDVVERQCRRFAEMGGIAAGSDAEVFANCDVVFLSLPSNELVSENLALAVKTCVRGSVVVDTSSSYPAVIQAAADAAANAGIRLVDCPVSGGESAAQAGTLAAMCGGAAADIAAVRPYIELFAAHLTHMGPLGCGYTAKLANNMIVGTEIALIAEAMNFAERAGLDKQRLWEAIRGGAADSAVMQIKGPKMIQKDYSASSRMAIHLKDQHNALRLGADTGAYMPLCTLATELMDRMAEEGRSAEDAAAILDLFERESKK